MESFCGNCGNRQAEIARKIIEQAAAVAAGRCRADQCPELSRLVADAHCTWSAQFPREISHEGRRYRLGVRGTLFVYAGDDPADPRLSPLLPIGVGSFAGFLPR